ncbi:transposase [Listeria booriae]|uniref:Transposase n=1 Tax=Listeria booriae TaxID=1552123 RepID=A0A7X0XR26_9LIST|nr:transposase [Listeria booriae]
MVIIDLSRIFRLAVQRSLEKPVIIADPFHLSHCTYWLLGKVRVQQHFQNKIENTTKHFIKDFDISLVLKEVQAMDSLAHTSIFHPQNWQEPFFEESIL